jgi:hypothetical protein
MNTDRVGVGTQVSGTLSKELEPEATRTPAAEKLSRIAADVRAAKLNGLAFGYGGGTVELRSDLQLELDELAELFGPFTSVEPLAAGASVAARDFSVVSVESPDVEALVADLDPSSAPHELYDGLPGRIARLSGADIALFRYEHPQWIVLLRPPEPRVAVLRSEAGYDRTLAEHLAKEPLKMAARSRGLFSLHAAACSFGHAGVVIAGARRSGKTPLLMHLVAGGAAYVGNDVVRLDLRRNGRVGLMPWPHMIRLDDKTVQGNALLRPAKLIERAAAAGDRSVTRGPDGKLELYYPTLAHIARQDRPDDRATLAAILLPEFDRDAGPGIEIEPIVSRERVRRTLEASLREHQAIRWLPVFDFDSADAKDAEGFERLLADLPPTFRVRYGPSSAGISESIRSLLAGAGS